MVQEEPQNQERKSSLVQEEPQPHIKDEQEEDVDVSPLTLLRKTSCDTLSGKKTNKNKQCLFIHIDSNLTLIDTRYHSQGFHKNESGSSLTDGFICSHKITERQTIITQSKHKHSH